MSRPVTSVSLLDLGSRPMTGSSSRGPPPSSRGSVLSGMSTARTGRSSSTARRKKKLRTVALKEQVDQEQRQETARRQQFMDKLKSLQNTLRSELSLLPQDSAKNIMKGKEFLLQQPDFSKPAPGWNKPASFAEIFQTHPGYSPTPRQKRGPEWDRLFNPNHTK